MQQTPSVADPRGTRCSLSADWRRIPEGLFLTAKTEEEEERGTREAIALSPSAPQPDCPLLRVNHQVL